MQLYELSLTEAIDELESGTMSPVELTKSVLERIAQVDDIIGAYVTVFADQALRDARQAEAELVAGKRRSPLHGIPIALKDLFDMKGVATTASSKVRSTHIATKDAYVTRALRDAGVVILGKTHAHEFAFGAMTPQTGNPWELNHSPGGSSGGSAAAVAYGGALAATGSDTGGSIRVPAGLCGVVGLKPTYGLVPLDGVVPLSPSLDHAGPITRTVADVAPIMDAIAIPQLVAHSFGSKLGRGVSGLRVGVPSNFFFDQIDSEIEESLREHLRSLEALGAELIEVTVPLTDAILPTQWGIVMPEAASVHAEPIRKTPQLYGDDVRDFLQAGSLLSAQDYLKAKRMQAALRRAWSAMFEQIDVLFAPTNPMVAPTRDQKTFLWPDGQEESVLETLIRMNAAANLVGFPALSVPAGIHSSGLPFGAQLIGRPYDEASLLQIGQVVEGLSENDSLRVLISTTFF
ncbi:MAG: amidase [Halodesulfovibrio sp.]|uniref:amidase n=1 Tax=Halodesulfovibrio sp. TaxID=1912772 RepID=UPI00359EFC72